MKKAMVLIAVMTFVPAAHARHHRQTEQRLRCPKLVEHAYPWTYGQPVTDSRFRIRRLRIRTTVFSNV